MSAALDRLLAVEGRFAELVDVVQKRADLSEGPGIRKVMLHRIAALYEDELEQPEAAIGAYKTAGTNRFEGNDTSGLGASALPLSTEHWSSPTP